MKKKYKQQLDQHDAVLARLCRSLNACLDRLDNLEICMDEATPKFPACGKTEECQLKDHIKQAMDESRAFYQQVQSEIPKWVR